MSADPLNDALLAAHAAGDGATLAALYATAGDQAADRGETDAACFFWVQALVFALEAGADSAQAIREKLIRNGREI